MKRAHVVLSVLVGAVLLPGSVSAQQTWLYSTDIGSDLDMSDPNTPGIVDAGAIYIPGGQNPVLYKGDDSPTGVWTGYPLQAGPQPPSGLSGDVALYELFFDLDAEDQLRAVPERGIPAPLSVLQSMGINSFYNPAYISFDDDGAPGWVAGDVPVTVGPDDAFEIYQTQVSFPVAPAFSFPVVQETGLTIGPNPLPGINDDDVDALDMHSLDADSFKHRFWSPDHEARLTLDPGDVYLTNNDGTQNMVPFLDDVTNFGLLDEVDIDAFEFVAVDDVLADVLGLSSAPGMWYTAGLFSVDEDDPLTLGIDESGGLLPNVIYLSGLVGAPPVAVSDPLERDIDAIAVAVPEPSSLILIGFSLVSLAFFKRRV